ncbi:MAG: hypothetical protein OHK0011_00600 [Turneriella sp.]
MKSTSLPLTFVFAFVSLYSSMTCTRVTAVPAEPVVVTKAERVPEAAVLLANAAPAEPQKPAAENTDSDKQARVVRFLQKLREYQLSWAQFPVKRPDFMKGIYLTNATAANTQSLAHFLRQSKKYGINTLVIDAQGKELSADQMSMIKSAGIYPVARIVCFDLGLKQKYPDQKHVDKIMASMERAAKAGFREIQLDYIRYADEKHLQRLPLKFKYDQIATVLSRARKLADSLGVELGADVFGRITLNRNDHIGQKLELFGQYVHNLYPMVYPSHYYGDPEKIANPYGTVKEGVASSIERIPQTRIIPYIQGFGMKIKQSGLALPQYVLKQFFAVDDAQGHGYVVWNARNDYSATWKALTEYYRLAPKRKQQKVAQAQGK